MLRPLFPGNQFVTPGNANGGHKIQEEGDDLPRRRYLNIKGDHLVASDDEPNDATIIRSAVGILQYIGGYSGTVSYTNRQVVSRWGAFWMWVDSNPSTPGTGPGIGTTPWQLISNTPVMNTAEKTAWIDPNTGDRVWDSTLHRAYVRASSQWHLEQQPYTHGRASLVTGPFADNVQHDVITAVSLIYGGQVTVAGRVEYTYNYLAAGTNSINCRVEHWRAGAAVSILNGGWDRQYFTAAAAVQTFNISSIANNTLPGDEIRILMNNQNNVAGRYQTAINDIRLSGVTIMEQPI